MSRKRKKRNKVEWYEPFVALIAIVAGFMAGFKSGLKPPPGDRRG